ncbi:MAG: hypothetical protein A2231_11935 [Candidatus Firestonebacteria bacterium RIFOXYA2_FULL_40_8]|nr:MAG: hypothetical protein A2231_11935 [Candidatus Firestonebacteria bacterium RIFOXYA2_FULL_40_8]
MKNLTFVLIILFLLQVNIFSADKNETSNISNVANKNIKNVKLVIEVEKKEFEVLERIRAKIKLINYTDEIIYVESGGKTFDLKVDSQVFESIDKMKEFYGSCISETKTLSERMSVAFPGGSSDRLIPIEPGETFSEEIIVNLIYDMTVKAEYAIKVSKNYSIKGLKLSKKAESNEIIVKVKK